MNSATTPYLKCIGLKKSYGVKPVLRGIDLSIESGRRVALLGANGAGKTTLLRVLACLTKPDAGTVSIGGYDVVHEAQESRQLTGFVAHSPYLYDELTARENLLFFGRMYGVKSLKERADLLLARVGLAKRANERAAILSRGQAQRLALARALLHSPSVLLLDEPDTGLDEEGLALLESILDEHTRTGGTTLLTTHSLERALKLSDRVGLLAKGRLVYQSDTTDLEVESVRGVYVEAFS